MMEVEDAVKGIRVIRGFARRALADEDLNAILNAGRHAGSSKNLQRWAFIVVRDKGRLSELAAVGDWAAHLAGGAAAIALVTPDPLASGAPLVHHVGPWPCRSEHDARRVGARHRICPGDG